MTAAAQREAAAARRRRARECAGDAYLTARELAARREAHALKRSQAAKERRDARAALFHETCGALRWAAYDRARRRAIRGDMAVAKCERAGATKRKIIAERKAAELRRVAHDAAVLARKALAKVAMVTDMDLMFEDAFSFNQPLNHWNVSMRDTDRMFYGASSFNQPLNHWNVSNVQCTAVVQRAVMRQRKTRVCAIEKPVTSFDTRLNALDGGSGQPQGHFNVAKRATNPPLPLGSFVTRDGRADVRVQSM